MPTYDYECAECGHGFEAFQGITAEPLKDCPKCGGAVKRMIGTGAGILFKGSGFYQTDYRSEGYQKAAASDKPTNSTPKKDQKSASIKNAKKAQ